MRFVLCGLLFITQGLPLIAAERSAPGDGRNPRSKVQTPWKSARPHPGDQLSFADLRLAGGLAGSAPGFLRLSLVGGEFGEIAPGFGLVLGLGLEAQRLTRIDDQDDASARSLGALVQFGVGSVAIADSHVELVANWGRGFASDTGGIPLNAGDGRWRTLGIELGWHQTLDEQWQYGTILGWGRHTVETDGASGRQQGFTVGLSTGYRF